MEDIPWKWKPKESRGRTYMRQNRLQSKNGCKRQSQNIMINGPIHQKDTTII